jgi:hypothetical protein
MMNRAVKEGWQFAQITYTADGRFDGTARSDATNVYLRRANGTLQHITMLEEFNMVTAAVYGEASAHGPVEEDAGIAHVIMNRAATPHSRNEGWGIRDIITHPRSGIYGYTNHPEHQITADNNARLNTTAKLVKARAGVIHAYTQPANDISLGSYFWEGLGILLQGGSLERRMRNMYLRLGWGNALALDGTGRIVFAEVTRIGGTVFMRYNPDRRLNPERWMRTWT